MPWNEREESWNASPFLLSRERDGGASQETHKRLTHIPDSEERASTPSDLRFAPISLSWSHSGWDTLLECRSPRGMWSCDN